MLRSGTVTALGSGDTICSRAAVVGRSLAGGSRRAGPGDKAEGDQRRDESGEPDPVRHQDLLGMG